MGNVKEVFHNLIDIIRQMNMEKKRKEINIEFRGIVAERRLNYEPRAPIAAQDRAEAPVAVQEEAPVAVQDEAPVAVQDEAHMAEKDSQSTRAEKEAKAQES